MNARPAPRASVEIGSLSARLRRGAALGLALLATGALAPGDRRGVPGTQVLPSTNLGVAIDSNSVVATEEHIVFRTREGDQRADLTGDGDQFDRPIFHYDKRRQALVRLGEDVRQRAGELPVVIEGDTVAFFASEANGDLNGDGDVIDFVVQTFDLARGVRTNLGLATDFFNFQQFVLRDGVLAMLVSERDTASGISGQGADLNGDGDRFDNLLFLHDVAKGTTTNTRITAGSLWIEDGLLGTSTFEGAQGADLNGDGDRNDLVIQVVHLADGSVENFGLAGTVLGIRGTHVLLTVNEGQERGLDLNGDGDASDAVLHLYDLATGALVNHELWAFRSRGATSSGYQERDGDGRFLALYTAESGQQADLNGDGDAQDFVLHVYDFERGSVTNTGFAVVQGGSIEDFPGITGGYLRFWVDEPAQQKDLNGDGDAEDQVLHVRTLLTGATRNVGLAAASGGGFVYAASAHHIAFQVSEQMQGQTDLNGDGDIDDRLAYLLDARQGTLKSLGTVHGLIGMSERFLLALEPEAARDLNADGDVADDVPVLWRLETGTRHELGLAGALVGIAADHLVVGVTELDQGNEDLNGNGLPFEKVAHVVPLFGRRPF